MKNIVKMIREEILNLHEIGDGSAGAIKYRKTRDFDMKELNGASESSYEEFIVETKSEIEVILSYYKENDYIFLDLSFGKKTIGNNMRLTNDHQQYKLIITIINIAKDSIIEKFKNYKFKVKYVEFIPYDGDGFGSKRKSLYMSFVNKLFSNSKVRDFYGNILIEPSDSFYQ